MTSKRGSMQAALLKQARGPEPEPIPDKIATPADPAGSEPRKRQPSRVGKVAVTGYFVPAVKSSFRQIQAANPDKTMQELLAEALNDLFAKYNVPQTARLDN
jgi:hypothetical protein